MMGSRDGQSRCFYYFRLEEQIPTDHSLRLIDGHVDFSFVREQLKEFYSATGRPSIDPEVLLRLLLIGNLYGITSERRLMDEVRMPTQTRTTGRQSGSQTLHVGFSEQAH
jgi:transposase